MASEKSNARPCVPESTRHLNIKSRQELQEFLREILPEFLRVVEPMESGLVDMLYSEQLMTATDCESMSGKDVNNRKEQARKLWFLLSKMPVTQFLLKVAPELIKNFPHIIPARFMTGEAVDMSAIKDVLNDCLHHDIRARLRPSTMADVLYHHKRLHIEDYEDITSGEFETDIVWDKMFGCCVDDDHSIVKELSEAVEVLLRWHNLPMPDTLQEMVSSGFPCTCNQASSYLPSSPSLRLRRVASWVKKSPFPDFLRCSGSMGNSMSPRSSTRSSSRPASTHNDDSTSSGTDNKPVSHSVPTSTVCAKVCTHEIATDLSPVPEEDEKLCASSVNDDVRVHMMLEASNPSVTFTKSPMNVCSEKQSLGFKVSEDGGMKKLPLPTADVAIGIDDNCKVPLEVPLLDRVGITVPHSQAGCGDKFIGHGNYSERIVRFFYNMPLVLLLLIFGLVFLQIVSYLICLQSDVSTLQHRDDVNDHEEKLQTFAVFVVINGTIDI